MFFQPPVSSQPGGMSYLPPQPPNQPGGAAYPQGSQPGMMPPPPPTSQTSPNYSQPSMPRYPQPPGPQVSGNQTGMPLSGPTQPMYGQTQPGQVPYGNNLSANFNNMSLVGISWNEIYKYLTDILKMSLCNLLYTPI